MRRQLTGGTATALVTLLLNGALLPGIVRSVGLPAYGLWVTVGAALAAVALLDLGVCARATREIAAATATGSTEDLRRICGATIMSMLVLAGSVGVAAIAVLPLLPHHCAGVSLRPYLLVSVVVLAVGLLARALAACLAGLQRSDATAWVSVGAAACQLAVTFAVGAAERSAWAPVIGAATGGMLQLTAMAALVAHYAGVPKLPEGALLRATVGSLFGAGSLVVLSQASDLVDFETDKLVLARYLGTAVSGAYAIGALAPGAIRALAVIPATLLLPSVAQLSKLDPARLQRFLLAAGRLTVWVAVAGAVATVVLAPTFFRVWLPAGARDASLCAQFGAVAVLANMAGAPVSVYALGQAWYRPLAYAAGSNVTMNAGLTVILTPHVGLVGALLGSVVGNVVGSAVLLILVVQAHPEVGLRYLCVPLATGAVLAGVAYATSRSMPAGSWPDFTAQVAVVVAMVVVAGAISRQLTPARLREFAL